VHQSREVSEYWQYGYKDAVAFAEKIKSKYQKVVVSTTLEQSYMFFLFYTKYDPRLYLAAGGTTSGGFDEANNHFDKYEFRKIDWPRELRDGTVLYVGDPKDMPHGNVMNYTFLDGKPAIEMADQPNGAP
jgi:prepilin-type processing-associated H-X9-DG protein